MFLEVARVILVELDRICDPEKELRLSVRENGRYVVCDAAFGAPLVEFDPNTQVD